MYIKEVKALIELLEASNLDSMQYKDKNFELTLEAKKENMTRLVEPVTQKITQDVVLEDTEGHRVEAPLVGVFYTRPSQDKDPYVSVGSQVQKGDILCIIEAMKVMNEIKAPVSGRIEKVFYEDGAAVSYQDVLYKIV